MKSKDDLQMVWSEFQTNTAKFISSIQETHDFSDVTLACDDAELVKAHRFILSAGSSFFETILRKTGWFIFLLINIKFPFSQDCILIP